MSEADDVIAIQNAIVNKERAKRMAKEIALTRDIRPMIAKGGGYNPDGDFPNPIYREYPKMIYLKDRQVVVNSRAEENTLLGKSDPPAKQATVEINEIAGVEQVKVKRKYTKRAAQQPLPQNLE